MKRIVIIGICGSGKSTFANNLGKKLNRSVIHLDKLFWTNEWERRYTKKGEWTNFQRELVKQDEWIMDGNYQSSLDIRLERADVIIYFDFPKLRSLLRVFVRLFKKGPIFDKTEGIKERVSWKLIKFIVFYPKNKMQNIVKNYKEKKVVYVVKNNKEINDLLNILTNC